MQAACFHAQGELIWLHVDEAKTFDNMSETNQTGDPWHDGDEYERFEVIAIHWAKIQTPAAVALWLLLATLVKMGRYLDC